MYLFIYMVSNMSRNIQSWQLIGQFRQEVTLIVVTVARRDTPCVLCMIYMRHIFVHLTKGADVVYHRMESLNFLGNNTFVNELLRYFLGLVTRTVFAATTMTTGGSRASLCQPLPPWTSTKRRGRKSSCFWSSYHISSVFYLFMLSSRSMDFNFMLEYCIEYL